MPKKAFDQNLYINDLVVFCIYSLSDKKDKCTFERLVKECFNLFPKTFSFSYFSKWPDTCKVERSLRRIKAKKLIRGNSKAGFLLTQTGKELAQEIAKLLGQRKLRL